MTWQHPILGAPVPDGAPGSSCWCAHISARQPAYLADHQIQGEVVLPAAAYVDAALSALDQPGGGAWTLEGVAFSSALLLGDEPRRLRTTIDRHEGHPSAFRIESAGSGDWRLHAEGRIGRPVGLDGEPLETLRARCAVAMDVGAFYEKLARFGFGYGARFRGVGGLWRGDDEVLAQVRLPEAVAEGAGRHALHPTLLDASFHGAVALFADVMAERGPAMPVGIDSVHVVRPGATALWAHVRPARSRGDDPGVSADVRLYDQQGAPVAALLGLRLRHLGASAARGRLILVDPGEQAAPLEAALRNRGQAAVRLSGSNLERDLAATLDGGSCRGVVVMAAAPASAPGAAPDLDARYMTALRVAQLLVDARSPQPPRLWLVTRGAQVTAAGDRLIDPAGATLWGLGRTIASEHPELRCTRVDLDPAGPLDALPELARELARDGAEQEIAIRSAGRSVARLTDEGAVESGGQAPPVRADASYLITGGLGALGLAAARWLAASGARHLILAARSAPGPEQLRAVRELERAGTQVLVDTVDVSDRRQVAALLESLPGRVPPLRGILHAAGAVNDAPVVRQDLDRWRAVASPKADGAWNLHELTRRIELDFLVFFSSVASLLGSPGQANYAAANAFLDALAHHRQGMGLRTLSINWGPFEGAGMVARTGQAERLAARGLTPMSPAELGPALEALLAGDEAQAAVALLDADAWLRAHPQTGGSSLLASLAKNVPEPPGAADPDLRTILVASPEDQHPAAIEDYVRQQVASILRLRPEQIDRSASLTSHGMDSLMAMELQNRVQRTLGLRVSILSLLQDASLRQLAIVLTERWKTEHLVEAMRAEAPEDAAVDWEVTRL